MLSSCDKWMEASTGQIHNISENNLHEMKNSIEGMAKKSLRTLCFAYKHVSGEDLNNCDEKGVY